MKRRKFLLPGEYLGGNPAHPAVADLLRRARPALVALWGVTLAGYLRGGLIRGEWVGGLFGVAISAGWGYLLWHALVTGCIRSNCGEFLRAAQPFRYWVSVAVVAAVYALILSAIFLGPAEPRHDAGP